MPLLNRIPVATYRLQFNREFTFERARDLVPYLHALGVTDLYASPLLAARRGSPHGYDVIDPTRINPELGGEEGLRSLVAALEEHGMGLLLDVVPNHMAASPENPWWFDLLRWGPNSPYASYFDLGWQPARPSLAGKVLLPILGSPYGEALEKGEIALTLTEKGFGIAYYQWWLPLKPSSHAQVLQYGLKHLKSHPRAAGKLQKLAQIFSCSPTREELYSAVAELWQLYTLNPEVKDFLGELVLLVNGQRGVSSNVAFLDEILSRQHYQLAFWRLANEEINYRRFFDVAELVSLRMEDERVFEATHSLILALAREGLVTGLRIDHIDGLRDPLAYLKRLQERLAPGGQSRFYVVAEKVLTGDEELPAGWLVCGTTGYDFLNILNALFVDGEGLAVLDEIYRRASGKEANLEAEVYAAKKKVMEELFGGEVRALVRQLDAVAAKDPHGRDLSLRELEEALMELTACLQVYRTYIREETVSARDKGYILEATEKALNLRPDLKRALLFLQRVLLLKTPNRPAALNFAMRWQQFTGPVMAKGFEDTALYTFNRLISLNEVGGSLNGRGISPEEFHRHNQRILGCWPHGLLATSTHDTKRSEDVRARINVLAEIPHLFAEHLELWQEVNRGKKLLVDGREAPGGNAELFIYQTLLGAWPLEEREEGDFRERLKSYLVKAAREAKTESSWLNPNFAYEEALQKFTEAILAPREENFFLKDFLDFQKRIAFYGALSSLAQVLLKIASPGVPDFYQGTELWNFSLVDPDNRRPVDFARRAHLLAELRKKEKASGLAALAEELLATWPDGRIKLYLTHKALHFRRVYRELFASGKYIPIEVAGPWPNHVCTFARRKGDAWALVAVPRLVARLVLLRTQPQKDLPLMFPLGEEVWGDTALILPNQAPRLWMNIFTRERVQVQEENLLPLSKVFERFPVALLSKAT